MQTVATVSISIIFIANILYPIIWKGGLNVFSNGAGWGLAMLWYLMAIYN